jgi:ketosteroid isomerase-like protein
MDFKTTTVSEALKNEQVVAVMNKYAPALLKTPGLKLLGKKNLQDIFNMVPTSKVPQDTKDKIKAEIEAI